MLTAIVAIAVFIGVVVNIGLGAEMGALSRRGLFLRVECPDGNTFIS